MVVQSVMASAAEKADITGVWTMYIEPGSIHLKVLVLLRPNYLSPLRVKNGMPAIMQTAGAYPIDFIQKGDQITIISEVEDETRRFFV